MFRPFVKREHVDMRRMCRLCLSSEDDVADVDADAAAGGGGTASGTDATMIGIYDNASEQCSLPLRIMACLALECQPTDGLPQQLCRDCREQLERFFYFRRAAANNDARLRRHQRLCNAGKRSQVFAASDDEYEDDYTESRTLLAGWDAARTSRQAARADARTAELERLLADRQREWLAERERVDELEREQRAHAAAEQEEAMRRLLAAKERVWQAQRDEAVRAEAERVELELRAVLEAELRADIEHEVRADLEAKWRELWSGAGAATTTAATTAAAAAASSTEKGPATGAIGLGNAPKRKRPNAVKPPAEELLGVVGPPDAAEAHGEQLDADDDAEIDQMFHIDYFAELEDTDGETAPAGTFTYVEIYGQPTEDTELDGGGGGGDQSAQQPNVEYLDDEVDGEIVDEGESILPVVYEEHCGDLMTLEDQEQQLYENGELQQQQQQQPAGSDNLEPESFATSEDDGGELQPIDDEEDAADDDDDKKDLDFSLDTVDNESEDDGDNDEQQPDTNNDDDNDNDDDDDVDYVPQPSAAKSPAARRPRRTAAAAAQSAPDNYRYTVKSSGPDQTTKVEVATGIGDEVLMVELVHAQRASHARQNGRPAGGPTAAAAAGAVTVRRADGTAAFACEPCGLQFDTRLLYSRHTTAVHGRPLSHVCEYCDRGFPSKSSLVRHVRRHTGEKPFGCDVCGRTFIQKEVLKRHAQVHTGERPHACEHCDRTFTQRELLRQHVNRTHSLTPVIDLHKCGKCSKSFYHASGLSRHMAMHMGKKFTCDACGKQFNDKSALRRHEGAMHGTERLSAAPLLLVKPEADELA